MVFELRYGECKNHAIWFASFTYELNHSVSHCAVCTVSLSSWKNALCIIPLHLMLSSLFLQFRVIWHSNVRYLSTLLLLKSSCGGRMNKYVNMQYQQIESTPGYGFIITFPHFLALFTFTLEEDFWRVFIGHSRAPTLFLCPSFHFKPLKDSDKWPGRNMVWWVKCLPLFYSTLFKSVWIGSSDSKWWLYTRSLPAVAFFSHDRWFLSDPWLTSSSTQEEHSNQYTAAHLENILAQISLEILETNITGIIGF